MKGGPARELLVVAAAVIGFFALAVRLELSEKVASWGSGYESWQLDELPLTFLVLSAGLAWFAFRRLRDARREVAERQRAEARNAQLLEQNRELAQRLILAQESERRALARDLHDQIGQDCTAIRAEASFLQNAQGDTDKVQAAAARIAGIAARLHGLVRDLLRRLRPETLDSVGLSSALQELCESWEKQSGIACAFLPDDLPQDLDDDVGIALFRIVQEALTNAARHSGATQVRIELGRQGRSLRLAVADDGRGMDDPERPHRGFGLVGMRERVTGLGGSFVLSSRHGTGVRIEATLPLEREAAA